MELSSSAVEKQHTSPERRFSPRPFDALGGDCTRRAKSCNPCAQLFPPETTAPPAPCEVRDASPRPRVRFLNDIQVFEYEQAEYADDDEDHGQHSDWSSVTSSDNEEEDDDEFAADNEDQGILVVFAPADRAYIPCLPNRRQRH